MHTDQNVREHKAFIAGILVALLVVGFVIQQMTYEKEGRQGAPSGQYVPQGYDGNNQ